MTPAPVPLVGVHLGHRFDPRTSDPRPPRPRRDPHYLETAADAPVINYIDDDPCSVSAKLPDAGVQEPDATLDDDDSYYTGGAYYYVQPADDDQE